MGPIRGWQDPGGPHVGPKNFVIWAFNLYMGDIMQQQINYRLNEIVWHHLVNEVLVNNDTSTIWIMKTEAELFEILMGNFNQNKFKLM